MNLNNNSDNSCSTDEQKLLMRAAILQGKDAIASWKKWISTVNIDDIDTESYNLLPLLYRNLSANGVTDIEMGRIKGVYRRTWCENQVLLKEIAAILPNFDKAGIKTILLKNAAVNLRYYQDSGLRMIQNIDLLIHPEDAENAINILPDIGWISKGKLPNKISQFTQSMVFENKSRQFLNLRWHLFGERLSESAEKDFWTGALALDELNYLSTYVLNPTDQLLYVCVSGRSGQPSFSVTRLADAFRIIQSCPNEIDWKKIENKARDYRLTVYLKNTLTQLNEIVNDAVPASILQNIQNLPVSQFERREFQIIDGENKTVLERFLMRYFQYSRMVNATDRLKFLGFAKYLQYVWGLEHIWEVPLQASIRSIKRLSMRGLHQTTES